MAAPERQLCQRELYLPYNDNGNGLFCKHIGALLLYDQKETAQTQKSCPSKIGLTGIPGVVRGTANLPEDPEPARKDSYASGLQMLFGRKWRGDEPESDPEARALLRTYREESSPKWRTTSCPSALALWSWNRN